MQIPSAKRLQAEASQLLYRRTELDSDAVSRADLAEALGVSSSTVCRQAIGDIPVQLRTLAALKDVDPRGARELLDVIGRIMGVEWRPVEASAPSAQETGQAVASSQARCSRSAALEWATLEDGEVDPDELVGLEQAWAREDHEREAKRAKLRAMCSDVPSRLREVS